MRRYGKPRFLPLAISLLTFMPNGLVTSAAAQSFAASHTPVPASAGTGAAGAAASVRTSPAPLTAAALAVAPLSLSAPSFSPAFSAPAAGVNAAPASAVPAVIAAAAPVSAAPAAARAALTTKALQPALAAVQKETPAENGATSPTEKAVASKDAESTASSASSLFDGTVEIARSGAEPVRTTLAELGGLLRSDPALLSSLNKDGKIRVVLSRGSTAETKAVRETLGELGVTAPVRVAREGVSRWDRVRTFIRFDWRMLLRSPKILAECYTKPNKQDYMYLATKTFGLNLAVRVGFAAVSVMKGDLTLLRAALMTGWYQGQDSLFTVFGQTYMKFIGRMTGLLQIGPAKVGDLLFIFMQLCTFEFINRLVLGPMGMNPLVYTWGGLSLILVNVLQGMLSGGPLIPAINKMRASGVISESMSMHLYQLASLTMLFGLAATFGYQALYTTLTTATMIVSWGAYAFFTFIYKGKKGAKAPEAKL